MSIIYNTFDASSVGMYNDELNLKDILRYLPKDRKCRIITNVKRHCGEYNNEFIVNVVNGKITNPMVLEKISKYMEENNSRSYFYEGLVAGKNGDYYFYWGS